MAYRKIDIDAFDEDKLLEEELYDPFHLDPAQAASRARDVDREVRGLLTRGDSASALKTALADAPHGPQHTDAKNAALSTLLSILLTTKSADVPALIRQLGPTEQDTLMKYLYKGMAAPDESGGNACAVLLGWHEKLTEVAGLGCIVRAMTDHRRV